MRKLQIMAVAGAALIVLAGGLEAQQSGKQGTADQAAMAAQHQNMMALQAAAIEAAQHLTQASGLDKATIQQEAATVQQNLRTIADHLADAEQHANGADKEHIAAVRAHEQEALEHAKELMAEAQKDAPAAAAISTHAQGVLTHAQAASKVMGQAHEAEGKH